MILDFKFGKDRSTYQNENWSEQIEKMHFWSGKYIDMHIFLFK